MQDESKRITLYGSVAELKQIEELLEESESSELFLRQEELTQLIINKTDSIVHYSKQQDDYLNLIEERIKELRALKTSVESSRMRFDNYVLSCLEMLGTNEIKGKLASLKVMKGRASVEVYDESLLAPELFRTKTIIEPDKIEIKKRLDANEDLQGARIKIGTNSIKYKIGL